MQAEDTRRSMCYDHFCFTIFSIVIFLFVTFIFYLNLNPSPTFTIHDVKLSTFNLSTTGHTPTLTTNLGITISSRNTDIDFGFEKIDVYASYRNQQITLPTMLPPMYLRSQDVMVWSLSLNGTEVPVIPDVAAYLVQDLTVGNVLISVEVRGRLRTKSGFLTGHYGLNVSCPEYIMLGKDNDTIGFAFKRPFVEGCDVGVN